MLNKNVRSNTNPKSSSADIALRNAFRHFIGNLVIFLRVMAPKIIPC
jgi:hypothetical protein